MIKRLLCLALLAVAACGKKESAAPADAAPPPALETAAPASPPQAGPPPPPYQMRAELPGGNRLEAAGRDGQALYENRCGSCHLAGGMGTNLLTKQRLAIGESAQTALLSNRRDLTADYVTQVARAGKLAMPRLTRVEVTDAELAAIAGYLARSRE